MADTLTEVQELLLTKAKETLGVDSFEAAKELFKNFDATKIDMKVIIGVVVAAFAIILPMFSIKGMARKVLKAMGYPKLEVIHPEMAEYSVGALRVRLSKDIPTVQIFYPVSSTAPNPRGGSDFIPYYRPKAIEGMLKFLESAEMADGILQLMSETPHPLSGTYAAEPLPATKSQKKFPLVVFSHGLGGTIEMYTELCAQLASLGVIVVAPEHADTSASYATKINDDGSVRDVWYQAPTPDSVEPYSRKKMVGFRGPHLEDRVEELTKLYGFLRCRTKATGGGDYTDPKLLSLADRILAAADPKDLHLVGHSFGGSTQLLAAQKWTATRAVGNSNPIVPLSITVFDTWNFALSDEILNKGIPAVFKSKGPPILSVISHEWTTNPEREQLLMFLRASQSECKIESYYAKNSVHQSFSDTEAWFPDAVATSLENRGENEERHVTVNAIVAAFAKNSGLSDSALPENLISFPID